MMRASKTGGGLESVLERLQTGNHYGVFVGMSESARTWQPTPGDFQSLYSKTNGMHGYLLGDSPEKAANGVRESMVLPLVGGGGEDAKNSMEFEPSSSSKLNTKQEENFEMLVSDTLKLLESSSAGGSQQQQQKQKTKGGGAATSSAKENAPPRDKTDEPTSFLKAAKSAINNSTPLTIDAPYLLTLRGKPPTKVAAKKVADAVATLVIARENATEQTIVLNKEIVLSYEQPMSSAVQVTYRLAKLKRVSNDGFGVVPITNSFTSGGVTSAIPANGTISTVTSKAPTPAAKRGGGGNGNGGKSGSPSEKPNNAKSSTPPGKKQKKKIAYHY